MPLSALVRSRITAGGSCCLQLVLRLPTQVESEATSSTTKRCSKPFSLTAHLMIISPAIVRILFPIEIDCCTDQKQPIDVSRLASAGHTATVSPASAHRLCQPIPPGVRINAHEFSSQHNTCGTCYDLSSFPSAAFTWNTSRHESAPLLWLALLMPASGSWCNVCSS